MEPFDQFQNMIDSPRQSTYERNKASNPGSPTGESDNINSNKSIQWSSFGILMSV